MTEGQDEWQAGPPAMMAQPATPESEFDPRNPNRRQMIAVTGTDFHHPFSAAIANPNVSSMGDSNTLPGVAEAIHSAVLAERERCARLVESRVPQWEECIAIAAAIRKGEA